MLNLATLGLHFVGFIDNQHQCAILMAVVHHPLMSSSRLWVVCPGFLGGSPPEKVNRYLPYPTSTLMVTDSISIGPFKGLGPML